MAMKTIIGASQLMGVADLTKSVIIHTLPLIKASNAWTRLEIETMNKLFPPFCLTSFPLKVKLPLLNSQLVKTGTFPQRPHIFVSVERLRASSDAVLHMSRIECKWAKSFVLPHLYSIRLMWSTASELGLTLILTSQHFVPKMTVAETSDCIYTILHFRLANSEDHDAIRQGSRFIYCVRNPKEVSHKNSHRSTNARDRWNKIFIAYFYNSNSLA